MLRLQRAPSLDEAVCIAKEAGISISKEDLEMLLGNTAKEISNEELGEVFSGISWDEDMPNEITIASISRRF